MTPVSYTANYQMMYLFLESARGELVNNTVRDTLQAYLTDLNGAVKENQEEPLKAISDSIYEYFQSIINDQDDVSINLNAIRNYLSQLDAESAETMTIFKNIFSEIVESH